MFWKQLSAIKSKSQFQRLTGVKPGVFEKMRFIVKTVKEQRRKHPHRGKVPKLSIEDQLLMMLMYHREYRSLLHIAADYGISEAQCWRIVTNLEDILIQSQAFCLPGKKALTKATVKWSVVLVDVAESPVERPKKNNGSITQEKRSDIPTKHNWS
jgi:hypothetical protein